MTLFEELKRRGLLADSIPGTDEYLEKNKVKAYIGYDPTAPSLTIGNLVTIMLLIHLQRYGHTPYVLFGGATGRIGDPSGKDAERKLLDIDVLENNLSKQKEQFSNLLSFDGENAAVMVNNYDWFAGIGFLDFLRDAGKHLTVNYMLSKESVKKRIETGISFTEFSYQLLQGYDFYHLYSQMGVKVQMGGSDQWGNITTGTEFIRRKAQGEAYALTCPLLTRADGTKFGKSEGQNIWLDPGLTSPYKMYQFFRKTTDTEAVKYLKIFSLRPIDEIEKIELEHNQNPDSNYAQMILAEDVTTLIHGAEELEKVKEASAILFGKGTSEALRKMDEKTFLEVFEVVPQAEISLDKLKEGINIIELLAGQTSVYASKGEAKRALQGNAISINKEKISDTNFAVTDNQLVNGKFILVQKGKTNYHLLLAK